jgi:hypothetical protein
MQKQKFMHPPSSSPIRIAMLGTLIAILTLGASAQAQQVTQNGFTSFDPPLSVATYPSAINRNG